MDLLHTVHCPAGEGPFPTVLALHGWGANAHDLLGLAPFLNGGEALVICPEGDLKVPIGQGLAGAGWFPITGDAPLEVGAFQRAVDQLHAFLGEAAERYPVDPNKLVLLGFSQGGVMAYALYFREPARYAALAGLSSWLPEPLAQAAPADDPAVRNAPFFVVHGTQDPMIPVDRARETRERLMRLGVDLTYREYEMGHEIRPEALRDLVGWLDEKALHRILLA